MISTEAQTSGRIQKKYIEQFGDNTQTMDYRLFRSPGRINLIGEHTDYNNGFVLPASVDKAVYFAISPRTDNLVVLHAVDLNETYTFSVDDISKPDQKWAYFQLGVIEQIYKNGLNIGGFQAAFGGDVPQGAGMSSSAALECCLLFALNEVFSLGLDRFSICAYSIVSHMHVGGQQSGGLHDFKFGRL